MDLAWEVETALAHLRSADERLAAVIDQIGPIPVDAPRVPYPALVHAIIYQQLAGAAAATIERRFLALYPHGGAPAPDELLATPEENLRSAGLSRQKIGYLRDLALTASAGQLGDDLSTLPDAEVVERVTAVKGVGRWTADMLLLFCLRRPDVLPVGDLGVRKGFQRLYDLADLPTPAVMEHLAVPWRPYRSVAARYLWRLVDTVV